SVFDAERARKWAEHCETNHSEHCSIRSSRRVAPQMLRLIDVVDNTIAEGVESPKYVALSYVWGTVPNFRLTSANKARLMRPGAINDAWAHLPMTIQDAITTTRKMGVRYLWADSLCLLQNDQEDLRQGVEVMDLIFEQSWLTIVGACGHDANAGLIGTSPGDRNPEPLAREVRPGVFMGVYFDVDAYLRRSVYESRAWTFQEHLLSRRILYFVGGKVFFRCRRSESCETCEDDLTPSTRSRFQFVEEAYLNTIMLEIPLQDYAWMIPHYTKRSLTKETDVLRAMAGIIRRVSDEVGYDMLQGIPAGAFDMFLLFHGTNLRRRVGLPSYSWTGWCGEVTIQTHRRVNRWLAQRTWIVWYHYDLASRAAILVWDLSGKHQSFPAHDRKAEGYRGRKPFRRRCPDIDVDPCPTTPSGEAWPGNTAQLSYPALRFWTVSVWFRIDNLDVLLATAKLINAQGQVCGVVSLDGLEDSKFFESEDLFEMILLSISDELVPTVYDSRLERESKFYNVMLLEWSEGIAERRGLGTIRQEDVKNGYAPGPTWKEIILA
ncbi:heterokaryon incompatibility protein-domain-containing protein, partial [Immersiella caudata]